MKTRTAKQHKALQKANSYRIIYARISAICRRTGFSFNGNIAGNHTNVLSYVLPDIMCDLIKRRSPH